MRLSDLRDARVKTIGGKTLGRVHEVHSDGGRITALTCGAGSFIERLTAKKQGRRVPWECVRKIERKLIVVDDDPPQRITHKKSSGARTPRGTRQPSARRSKR